MKTEKPDIFKGIDVDNYFVENIKDRLFTEILSLLKGMKGSFKEFNSIELAYHLKIPSSYVGYLFKAKSKYFGINKLSHILDSLGYKVEVKVVKK